MASGDLEREISKMYSNHFREIREIHRHPTEMGTNWIEWYFLLRTDGV